MRGFWRPAVVDGTAVGVRVPKVGQVIARDRRPYRVLEAVERRPVDWSDNHRQAWEQAGMPDPWAGIPTVVVLQPLPSGAPVHVLVGPTAYGWFHGLPEHYAVCVGCGELAPCHEVTARAEAKRIMERVDWLSSVLPGCCWGCGEPITARQASIVFPGDNLLLPTAPADPVFHARSACRSRAAAYEEQWVTADPSRPRSLLTLRCAGHLVVHHDGSAECFGAVESDCPDWRAQHRTYTACYAQTHGCPRACPREGHPGCRPGGHVPGGLRG